MATSKWQQAGERYKWKHLLYCDVTLWYMIIEEVQVVSHNCVYIILF